VKASIDTLGGFQFLQGTVQTGLCLY